MTNKPDLSLATKHGDPGVAFVCNSEFSRPTVYNDCGIARNDQERITLSEKSKIEDLSSTMTKVSVEAGSAGWEGKLGAFMQASEQCRTQLLWQAQRFTNSREEAEDIVQEALLRAFKNLPNFRGESQMGTWLHVIVRNVGLEWVRNRKGRDYLPLECVRNRDDRPVVLDLPDPGRNPEQCCEQKEMDKILLSKIEGLNSIAKHALQMCFLDELSLLDAASELGVSVGTIKSRLFHGKQMLKRAVYRRDRGRKNPSRSMEPAF